MRIHIVNIYMLFVILFATGCATTQSGTIPRGPVAHAPKMHVGDRWTTKISGKFFHFKVISVAEDGSFVLNRRSGGGNYHLFYTNKYILEKVINLTTGKTTVKEKPQIKWIDFPLFVGKSWESKYRGISIGGQEYNYEDNLKVVGYETVDTQAGSFKAFKIRRYNYFKDSAGYSGGPYTTYLWYSPEINNVVKYSSRYQNESKLQKLISYTPAGQDTAQPPEATLAKKSTENISVGSKKEGTRDQAIPHKPAPAAYPQQPARHQPPVQEINEPPRIIITNPVISKTRNGKSRPLQREAMHLNVTGQAISDSGMSEVIINGVSATLGQYGHFSSDVPLNIGKNIIRIVAIDNHKLASQKKITVTRIATTQKGVSQKRRLALIIGNADYTHGAGLTNPVHDARAIASILKKLNFQVIIRENLSQKDMKRSIDQFGQKLHEHDVGLFFYAGHGVQVNGTNFLVPGDADINSKNDVEYDCVSASRVLAKMEDAGSKTNIVILDACRDNPFERRWTRKTRGSGLAFMNAPSGSLIAYATAPGSTALDGSGKNGLYTTALLENLTIPGISILEMFQRVRTTVIKKSDGQQVPWESTSLRENFYFSTK